MRTNVWYRFNFVQMDTFEMRLIKLYDINL